ncbi:unnamed protein product [Litomosoides sigmodontis]|uniref:Tudor domain-containing protein n=1 Tax=Litomosoides sigmodontis TaxID=42156 RepID=A0A3P6SS24_LITSI|nr:unnamed protein product [Litomosoides sigmodontis]
MEKKETSGGSKQPSGWPYSSQKKHCDGRENQAQWAVQALFTQTAFKQYEPEVFPTIISVRFDKKDRVAGKFWVIHKGIFSAVEKALKEGAKRVSEFPSLLQGLDDDSMRKTPCVVRTRAESAYKTFYRAVPSRFDARTKRFSIFLVDFGWFKWVLANDVIDISTMDKSNPIRNLPVAMIHCQEDITGVLHSKEILRIIQGLQDLWKGANCCMKVKGCTIQDVYLVDLLEADIIGETKGTSSTNNSPSETCQRQLMTSAVLGTLKSRKHRLTAQTQHIWSLFCPSPFSMTMPIALPMMMSLPALSANLASTGYGQHSQTKNIENTGGPQNNAKSPGSNSKNRQKEWHRSDLSERNRATFASGRRARNSFNGDSGSTSRRVRLTSWKKGGAADCTIRTQDAPSGEHATSSVDDRVNQLT